MDRFSKMIEDIKNDIGRMINNPSELPPYMTIGQLNMIINELDKMNELRDMKLFMPYYPKGIADCWDINDTLGNTLLDVLSVYKKL